MSKASPVGKRAQEEGKVVPDTDPVLEEIQGSEPLQEVVSGEVVTRETAGAADINRPQGRVVGIDGAGVEDEAEASNGEGKGEMKLVEAREEEADTGKEARFTELKNKEESELEDGSSSKESDHISKKIIGEVGIPEQIMVDSIEKTTAQDVDKSAGRSGLQEETLLDKRNVLDDPITNDASAYDQPEANIQAETTLKLSKKEQMRARLAAKKKAKEMSQEAKQSSAEQESSLLADSSSKEKSSGTSTSKLPKTKKPRSGRASPRAKDLHVELEPQMKNLSYFDTDDFIESVATYDRGLRHLYDRYRCAQVVTGRFVTFSEISSKWSLINFNELFRLCKDFGIVHTKGLGRQELKRIFIVCTDPKGNMQALTFEQFRKFLSLCADELLNTDKWRDKYPTVQSRVNALFFHMGLSEDKKNERNKRMRAFGGFMYGDGMLGGHDEVCLDRAGKSPFQGHDYTKGTASTDNILASIEYHEAEQEGDAELHPLGASLRTDKRIHNPFALSSEEEQDLLEKCGLAEPEESKEEAKRKAHWESIDSLNVVDLFAFKPLPRQKKPIPRSPPASLVAQAQDEVVPSTLADCPPVHSTKATRLRVASPCSATRSTAAQVSSKSPKAGPRRAGNASLKNQGGKKPHRGEMSRSRKFLNKLQQAKAKRKHGVAKRTANTCSIPKRVPPSHTYSPGHKSSPKPPFRKPNIARSTRSDPSRRQASKTRRSLSPARKQTYARSGQKPPESKSALSPTQQHAAQIHHAAQPYQQVVSQQAGMYVPPRGVGVPGIPGMMPGAPYVPFYAAMPYGTMPVSQPLVYPQQVQGHYGWVAQGGQQPLQPHQIGQQLPGQ